MGQVKEINIKNCQKIVNKNIKLTKNRQKVVQRH